MRKKVLLGVLFCLLLVMPFVMCAEDDENSTSLDSSDEKSKIDKAYSCLNGLVDEQDCDDISSEEKIFVLLATGKCKSEVSEDSKSNECWPDSGCNIKTTSQAILALDNSGSNTEEAEEWLLDQKQIPEELDWFLQIENPDGETFCTIDYGSHYDIVIGEDRKVESGAGKCLSVSSNGYWLRVSSSCYDEEFSIKCDKRFSTNLLYKKETSSTIFVSSETHGTSAEGTTIEKVSSYCFGDSECDYEGSLWAAMVLDYLGEDVSSYIPYLVASAEDNPKLIPESFLQFITGEYRDELLAKQKSEGYWDESGDKFYDTALALYPFPGESSEKSNSKNWLLTVQEESGCWRGIRNTAFVLASVWGRTIQKSSGTTTEDCEDHEGYCISSVDCVGTFLDYDCASPYRCCSLPREEDSCEDLNGEVCVDGQECSGGNLADTYELDYGKKCCVGGRCIEETISVNSCVDNFGICRVSCEDDEEENFDYTCDYGDSCCFKEKGKSYFWIWVLLVLIVLTGVGIFYKDKLREVFFRFKSKFNKSNSGPIGGPRFGPRPGFPPSSSGIPLRPVNRNIFPPRRPMMRRPMPQKKVGGEIDDVLKKLKEMGGK